MRAALKSISARHKIYLIFKHNFSNSEAVQVNIKVITMHLVQCRCQFQVSNLNIKDDFPTEPVLINTVNGRTLFYDIIIITNLK